jgi:F420H(2)-dependent quinone reductase
MRFDVWSVRWSGSSLFMWVFARRAGLTKDAQFESRKARALVLTTKGRRSGRKRSVVLPYFTVDDKTFVVGSKGGAPEDPDWVRNLQATPVATVFIDRRPCIVAPRVATPAERALLWARLIAVAPTYDAYQKGTAREIPLMILERL